MRSLTPHSLHVTALVVLSGEGFGEGGGISACLIRHSARAVGRSNNPARRGRLHERLRTVLPSSNVWYVRTSLRVIQLGQVLSVDRSLALLHPTLQAMELRPRVTVTEVIIVQKSCLG